MSPFAFLVRFDGRLHVLQPDEILLLPRRHERQFDDLDQEPDVVAVVGLRDPDDFTFRQHVPKHAAQIAQHHAAAIREQMIKPFAEPRNVQRLRLDHRDGRSARRGVRERNADGRDPMRSRHGASIGSQFDFRRTVRRSGERKNREAGVCRARFPREQFAARLLRGEPRGQAFETARAIAGISEFRGGEKFRKFLRRRAASNFSMRAISTVSIPQRAEDGDSAGMAVRRMEPERAAPRSFRRSRGR